MARFVLFPLRQWVTETGVLLKQKVLRQQCTSCSFCKEQRAGQSSRCGNFLLFLSGQKWQRQGVPNCGRGPYCSFARTFSFFLHCKGYGLRVVVGGSLIRSDQIRSDPFTLEQGFQASSNCL